MDPNDPKLSPDHNNSDAWNQRYLSEDIPWDKQAPCPGLVDWLAANPSTAQGRWLVPGCGLGHDVQALADAGADALGIDLSERAAEQAIALGRNVVVADLFNLSPEFLGAFDGVWEHTCFCAIHPDQRDAYAAAVASTLKPGGTFLGIFFEAESDSKEGPPFKTRFDTVRGHLRPHLDIVRDWVPERQHRAADERMLIARRRSTLPASSM